ncbi:MAG: glycosyltransferase family 4 protein [Pseudomonadota bacterium]
MTSVLFITRKWPPAVGGMETYSAELVTALRKMGHDVELIHLPGSESGDAPRPFAILLFGLRTVLRLLWRRGDWAVVHGGDLAVWPLVWLAMRRSAARPFLTAHGTDVSFAFGSGFRRRLYHAYLGLGRRWLPSLTILANSRATSAKLGQLGFAGAEPIPLGCRVIADVRAEDPATLLFAGRLVERKGLSWFVDEVLPNLPDGLRLAVAGTIWDASESSALADPRVDDLGPLPQRELWARMGSALAVVIPNRHSGSHQFEGFGLIAAEAAASGGLVLASDLDGYRDSVIDGKTGRLLPPEDAKAWISAITALARQSPEDRAAQRRTAQAVAVAQFDWSRVARDTVAVYERSAADPPPTS